MRTYILQRLLQLIPVLLLTSIAVFLLIYLIPGDPALIVAGPDASREQVDSVRRQMGLDQPLPVQYGIWLGRVVQGDLGKSMISDTPVTTMIGQKLPVTLELTLAALIFAIVVSMPLGILAAVRPGSFIAAVSFWWSSLALAIPTFWLGILLVMLFGLQLEWLPTSGYVAFFEEPSKSLKFLIMPAITLGGYVSAVQTRFVQSALQETLTMDFVRTARAKGLRERSVVLTHVLKNALIPVITVLGLQFGTFLGGAVVTESLFDYPGMGRMMLQAILQRDYPVLQGALLFIVTLFVLINLLTDVVYAQLDPRIRY